MMGQNGKRSGRRECIFRAITLVKMFETQHAVTVRDIMDEFEITKQSAQVWMDEMSRIYPVVELGEAPVVLKNGGRGHINRKLYGFMP